MMFRTCAVCGIQARSREDLGLFRKKRLSTHGRENLCKACYNDKNRNYGSRQKQWHELVDFFPKPLRCCHCGDLITDIESTREKGSLAIHSIDGNHNNWNPMNKTPMHLECHSRFHNAGEKNPRYKGEKAK